MQPDPNAVTANALENLTADPNFLVPILIGLAIAVAVQLLLTHLAAAVGLSAAGDLSETEDDGRDAVDGIPPNRPDVTSESPSTRPPTFYERVQKVNHTLGAWGLISATLALFIGAWLATETSLTIDPTSGVVIGLAIWAVFYCAAMYLETTLIGSLVRRGVSAVGWAAGGVGSVFTKSSKKSAAQHASAIAASVRDEILEDKRVKNLGSDLRSVIDAVEQNTDPAALRSELETLIDRTEVEFDADADESSKMVASMNTRRTPRSHKLKKAGSAVANAVSVAQEEYDSDRRPADSVARGAMRVGGISDEDADRHISTFEEFLRSADEDVLDPDAIKTEIETLFSDPGTGWAAIKERCASADRSTFEGLLTARGMDDERATAIVDRVASFADSFQSGDDTPSRPISERASKHAAARARQFADGVDDRRLDGEAIEREVELLFDDPKAGADAIINRLKTLDRDTIKAVIASRPNRDEQEAEEIISRVERARDRVAERAEQMKLKVAEKTEQAKQKTLDTAEGTRKVASTAAWWAFGAATCSAASAAFAGYLAVIV